MGELFPLGSSPAQPRKIAVPTQRNPATCVKRRLRGPSGRFAGWMKGRLKTMNYCTFLLKVQPKLRKAEQLDLFLPVSVVFKPFAWVISSVVLRNFKRTVNMTVR